MTYLLDTHTLIWFGEGNPKLPESVRSIVIDPANAIFVSHASIWEMTIKVSLGKLTLRLSLPEWENLLHENHFLSLTTTFRHFEVLKMLPYHHADPFDRLLIAQAMVENMTVITHDAKFQPYPVQVAFF